MVADALIYHPSVTHYLKFVATTAGRDKILRTVQYFSRFYAWYLLRTNNPKDSIELWSKLKKQLGLCRKVIRVGKFVEHFKAAAVATDKKGMDPLLRYCAIGRQLGYGFYILFDNVLILDVLGVRKHNSKDRISREAARFWMTGILFNVVAGSYTLYHLNQRSQGLNKSEAEGAADTKKLEKEWNAASRQLIQDLCDLMNPATTLGITNFDDGALGLAGTLSSLLGVYSVWQKTA